MRVICLIVAAGRGIRARQADGVAKQYQHIGALPVLTRTLRAFATHPRIERLLVVINPDDRVAYEAATQSLRAHLLPPVAGGATRQASVRAGLEALATEAPDVVLIHDAARPFIRHELIDRVLAELHTHAGVIPALAVADTLKRNAAGMHVGATVSRNGLYRAQTPQAFRFDAILAAHRAAAVSGLNDFTDDAAVAEWHGIRIAIVEGAEINRKLTTVADIRQADREFRDGSWDGQERRSGLARAALRLVPGDHLVLCGARVPFRRGLANKGRTDPAGAVIAEALLRAARLSGERVTLAEAGRRVREAGGGIATVDLTILNACASETSTQHARMRGWIAENLAIDTARTGILASDGDEVGLPTGLEDIVLMAHAVVTMPEPLETRPLVAVPVQRPAATGSTSEATELLDHLGSPAELRELADEQLPQLAAELRREVINAVSTTGGHLGSNLGVVELTIALH